jgi:hypothetical protein
VAGGLKGSPPGAIWWWIRLAAVIVSLFVAAPVPPIPAGSGLDASWIIGLNAAHARGFVFGQDIVFTYGPLGYLLFPIPGFAGRIPALLMGLLPFAVFAFSVLRLSLTPGIRARWVYIAVLFAAWLFVGDLVIERVAIASIACLVSTLALVEPAALDLAILGTASALTPGIKLNGIAIFIACYAAIAGVVAWRIHAHAIKVLFLAALPPIVVIAPFLTNGCLSVLPQFLAGTREIINGYSEAMSYSGPLWQCVAAIAALSGFFVMAAFVVEKRALVVTFIPAALVAVYAFKNAMVRQYANAETFHFWLALAVAILATGVRSHGARRLVLGFALLNVAAGIWITDLIGPQLFSQVVGRWRLAAPANYVRTWVEFPRSWTWLAGMNRPVFKSLQLPRDFDAIIGGRTVEALPYSIDRVIANGWRWAPRPVIQTYSAYTPYLDGINAAHVRGHEAADLILLTWGTIDQRHMFFEDPASWVATLSNYHVRLTHADFSLLERRHSPLLSNPVPMGQTVVGWNQETKLPATPDLLIMHADIRYSPTGALRRTLLHATPVFVAITKASGAHASWRAVQSNLRDGAIINFLPESTEELALLAGERKILPEAVTSIHFETAHPSDYASEIGITWERRPMRSASGNGTEEIEQQLWSPASELPRGVDTKIDSSKDAIRVNTSTNDPQLYFPCHRDLRSFGRIVIRARFQKRDYIDLFFGPQINGRGMDAMVPVAGAWLDVDFNVAMNPFWASDAGTAIRFDPSSGVRFNSVDIAGIWGVEGPVPADASPVEFRPVADGRVAAQRRTLKN